MSLSKTKRQDGWWYPYIFVGAFVVIITVNGIMAFFAVDTWTGLEILDSKQKGDLGRVEFRATFSVDGGPEQVHHETSAFHRHKGVWLYLEGEVK